MIPSKEKNLIDVKVQLLESALKSHEQNIKLKEAPNIFFSPQMAHLIKETLNKIYVPGIDIDVIIKNAYALSLSAINRIRQEIREDPKKLFIKVSVGVVILGLVLKLFNRRTSAERSRTANRQIQNSRTTRNFKRKEGV